MKTGRFRRLRPFRLLVLLDIVTFVATLAYSEVTNGTFSLATTEATAITASSAELHGVINPGGTSAAAWFEWGATPTFGNRTETRLVGDGTNTLNLSQSIGNLQPRTTYYFRVVGYQAAGNLPGETRTFTTSGDVAVTELTVTTGDAGDVTSNSAAIAGTVNPGGTASAWLEWGTTTVLANRTEAQAFVGTTTQNLSAALRGLQPHTIYYFRAASFRPSDGRSALGEVHMFTTADAPVDEPVTVITSNASEVTASSCVLNGIIDLGVNGTGAAWFEWGSSTTLENRTEIRALSSADSVKLTFSLRELQAGATYYFRAVGYRSGGSDVPGSILTCTTSRVVSTTPETTSVEQGDIKSGYVIITPDGSSSAPTPTMTFGIISGGSVQSQAGIIPTSMATDASVFIEVIPRISRNIGVAIVNPGSSTAAVNLTLRDENGIVVGSPANVSIPARAQVAKFVNELFDADTIGLGFRGSLRLQSSTPFSVVGLRFSGFVFSTLSVAVTAPVPGVPSQTLTAGTTPNTPLAGTVGGSNALIVPQFAIAGGWATQIALVNNTTSTLSGRIDLFDTAGNPMGVNLNGETRSTFNYSIPVGGTFVLAPRDSNGQSPL
jgi:hypothetical protein